MRPKNTPSYTASSVTLCVPSGEGAAIVTAKAGACEAGFTKTTLLAEAEQEAIEHLLPYVNFVKEGVGKKPTVQISGANLQVINGSGLETTINGTGNLVLGYDPSPGTQTGSHNLLLGGTSNSYTSYGGIVGGSFNNKISGPYASILNGAGNTASGYASTINGGYTNRTTTNYATVSGGCSNLAGTGILTVSSACTNTAYTSYFPSVLGGAGNQASAENATVSGGSGGEASGVDASVTGGRLGKAPYRASTILGGLEEVTEKEFGITP